MAAADDIVLNVVLTGNEEFGQFFDRIRQGGEQAFVGLDAAVTRSTSTLGALGLALGAVAAAFTTVGVGAFAFTASMAEATDSVGDLAAQTGATTEEISGLQAAFAAGGGGPGELEQAFRRLSVTVSQSWAEIRRSQREGADQAAQNSNAVISANQNLSDSLKRVAEEERTFADQRKQNTFGLQDAEARLAQARLAERRAAGQDTSLAEAQLQRQQQRLAVEKAQVDVQQAQRRVAEQAEKEEEERVKNAVAADNARLARNQALRKEESDRKNDLTNVIDAVKQLAEGNKDALKDIEATPENLAKGIVGAAGESSDAIKKMQGDIGQIAGSAPQTLDVFKKIGEVLGNIEDPALKAATAARLLGRSVSQDLIDTLKPGNIDTFVQKLNDLNLATTQLDVSAADDFRAAMFSLQTTLGQVGQKMGTALSPAFTRMLESIDEFVAGSKDKMIDWAQSVGDSVEDYLDAVERVRDGETTPDDEGLKEFIDNYDKLVDTLGRLGGVISGAADQLKEFNSELKNALGIDFSGLFSPFDTMKTTMGEIRVIINAIVDAVNLVDKVLGGKGGGDSALQGARERVATYKDFFFGNADERKKAIEDYNKADEAQRKRDKEAADAIAHVANLSKETTSKQIEEKNKSAEATESTTAKEVTGVKQVTEAYRELNQERTKGDQGAARSSQDRIERLKAEAKELAGAEEQQRKKAQDAGPGFIDKNGIRSIPGPSGAGPTGTLANAMAEAAARALGVDPSDVRLPGGQQIARGSTIQGDRFLGEVPVSRIDPSRLVRESSLFPEGARDEDRFPLERTGRGRIAEGARDEDLNPLERTGRDRIAEGAQDAEREAESLGRVLGELGQEVQGLLDTLKSESEEAGELFNKLGDDIQQMLESLKPEETTDGGADADEEAAQDIQELGGAAEQTDESLQELAGSASGVASAFESLIQSLSEAAAQPSGGDGGNVEEFAEGGKIGGKRHSQGGTVIEAEEGEFMHRRAAVNFWGEDLMHAINKMDVGIVRVKLPKFEEGGLITKMITPRFSDSVAVATSTSSEPNKLKHLGVVDLRTDHGDARVFTDDRGVKQLTHMATTRRMTAASKKSPGFVS
jgi:NTP pyrophosphatase (non-canonical NTP hydrolase)